MKHKAHIWLRDEHKPHERRTALTPTNAETMLKNGFKVSVEESSDRVFPIENYKAIGCEIVRRHSWPIAPKSAFILGLKELPSLRSSLIHRHIHFAHAYKNQIGWKDFLNRFDQNGRLYDLEYLVFESGKRVAAFGYWAGFVGAALGVDIWAFQQCNPVSIIYPEVSPFESEQRLVDHVRLNYEGARREAMAIPSTLVIGAKGRCGKGANQFLKRLGLKATLWDRANTSDGGPFLDVLNHHILINTVLVNEDLPPFISKKFLNENPRVLSVISDVSCDPTGPYNPIPLYEEATTFTEPIFRVEEKPFPLDLTAIDHLPSLLPKESSEDFSNQLLPFLLQLPEITPVWKAAEDWFFEKSKSAKI